MTRSVEKTPLPSFRNLMSMVCMAVASTVSAQPASAPMDAGRDSRLVAHFEQVPHQELMAIYVACSNEAEARLLGAGEAAACSIAYEMLKRRVFGGDFDALLAWSRSTRTAQSQSPAAPALAARR